jgi:hypothetical protein
MNMPVVSLQFDADTRGITAQSTTTRGPAFTVMESMCGRQIFSAVEAVLSRDELDLDDAGFRYPNLDLLEWDEPVWEGVKVWVFMDVQYIPEPDFARLMLRVAQTFIAGAKEHDHPMLREPWWPELLHATSRLEAQVAAMEDQERLGA